MLKIAAAGILAYLMGSITFGMLVPRWMGTSSDVRKEGSGNVGATNVLRTQGKLQGGLVLLGDLLKGTVAAGLGLWLAGTTGGGIAGICAMLGHCFPLYFGFKGGKAVATVAGAMIVLIPVSFAYLFPLFVLSVGISRMVSLGSILVAAGLAVSPLFIRTPWPVALFCVAGGAMVIWKHQGNIQRIRAGTENKLGGNKKKDEP